MPCRTICQRCPRRKDIEKMHVVTVPQGPDYKHQMHWVCFSEEADGYFTVSAGETDGNVNFYFSDEFTAFLFKMYFG